MNKKVLTMIEFAIVGIAMFFVSTITLGTIITLICGDLNIENYFESFVYLISFYCVTKYYIILYKKIDNLYYQ